MSQPTTNYIPFLRDFWRLVRPLKGAFLKLGVFILTVQVGALFEPFVVKHILDEIVPRGREASMDLWKFAALAVCFLVTLGIVQVYKNKRIRWIMSTIEHDLPLTFGQKMLNLPLTYHHSKHAEAMIGKVVRGVGRVMDIIGVLSFEIVPLFFQTIVTIIIILWLYWPAVFILFPVVVVFAFVTGRVKQQMSSLRRERHALDNDADSALGQAITNILTTQVFRQEERELALVRVMRDEVKRLLNKEYSAYDWSDLFRNGLVSSGRIAMITLCAFAVFGGSFSVGTLVFLSTLSERVFISCYRLGTIFDRFTEAMEPVRRMVEVMDAPVEIYDPETIPVLPARFVGEVTFDAVTYSYRMTQSDGLNQQPALNGLTLTITPGEVVGIVGSSGGGKSTFAKALFRLLDPDVGAIRIDGFDLRELPLSFRQSIGYVPQEVEIFDRTVAENIAFGKPNAAQAEIEQAARVANAHEFILRLERGYQTVVGNRGMRLSGGQRQRVGIARAILMDPPILLFDEATSNVDVVSERKIHHAIDQQRGKRTVIIIAHRLSTVQNADRIIVLEDGSIKEMGDHAALLRQNGLYRRLVALQELSDAVA